MSKGRLRSATIKWDKQLSTQGWKQGWAVRLEHTERFPEIVLIDDDVRAGETPDDFANKTLESVLWQQGYEIEPDEIMYDDSDGVVRHWLHPDEGKEIEDE